MGSNACRGGRLGLPAASTGGSSGFSVTGACELFRDEGVLINQSICPISGKAGGAVPPRLDLDLLPPLLDMRSVCTLRAIHRTVCARRLLPVALDLLDVTEVAGLFTSSPLLSAFSPGQVSVLYVVRLEGDMLLDAGTKHQQTFRFSSPRTKLLVPSSAAVSVILCCLDRACR